MNYQKIIDWCLCLSAAIIPIFFFPWITEPLEIGKQTLLAVLIIVALLAKIGQKFTEKQFSVKKSLADGLLVIFLAGVGLSTILSGSRFLGWVGTNGQEYTSFVSFLLFAILFWLTNNRGQETIFLNRIIFSLTIGTIVSGIIGLFQILGIFLPFSFSQIAAFNTIGTINSLGLFLAVTTVLSNGFIIFQKENKKINSLLALVLSIITLFFLILTNNWINWIILLIGSVLNFGLCFWQAGEVNNSKKYLLTAGLTIVAVLFLLIKITTLVSTPAEILPNTTTSVAIIKQTLNKYGWWFGSGPGTYLFDYSEFKPLEINQTNFWDTRFNSGASAFFTFLPTLGVIPTVTFLSFFLITLMFFKKNKAEKKSLIIFPPLITVITAFFLYPTNFSLLFLFFLLAGLSETSQKNQNLVFTIKNEKVKKGLLLGLIFILIIALFLSVQRLWADNAFTKAIRNEQGNDLITTITQIDQAASINRFNDVYYRVLAEALFIESQTLTNELKVINPTAEQSAYLKNLLAAGLNSAKLATELEPRRATNWLEFGSIYRAMIGLSDDASGFAISAFKTAIALEPTNPKNYLELGQAFLATKEFSLAEATFNKAIELKPDYANAHYQLALAFEQQGKLDEAIGKMENIIKYNPQDIGATFELGVLYLRRLNEGDLTRAEDILKKTIELLPSFSNARWYLAYTYEKEGKLAEAIAEIEKVLELNPDNEMVKARLERLKNGEGGGEVELME